MINLDQVRTLEWKVKQAVQLIVHLRRENDTLRGRLSDTEVRLQELESLLEAFKATQSEMETGIRSALEELDHLDGVPAPAETGQVDPLSYPPVAESEPEPLLTVTVEALPVRAVVSEEPEVVEAQAEVASPEGEALSFEEEFAALAAAEAAALVEETPAAEEPVPESVELEAEAVTAEAEPEEEGPFTPPPADEPEERGPEQPGLGIF